MLPILILALFLPGAPPDSAPEFRTGVAVDLLPPVASLLAGHAGWSFQTWAGFGSVRARGVLAGLHLPSSTDPRIRDPSLAVAAAIVDLFANPELRGPWGGVGLEWWRTAATAREDGRTRHRSDPVATLGAGWILPLGNHVYIEPWGAVHRRLGSGRIQLPSGSWRLPEWQAEVSLKLGWSLQPFIVGPRGTRASAISPASTAP